MEAATKAGLFTQCLGLQGFEMVSVRSFGFLCLQGARMQVRKTKVTNELGRANNSPKPGANVLRKIITKCFGPLQSSQKYSKESSKPRKRQIPHQAHIDRAVRPVFPTLPHLFCQGLLSTAHTQEGPHDEQVDC